MIEQVTASEAFDTITDDDGSGRDVNFSEPTWAFKVRCQDIAALYNKQTAAKKACVEYLCSPNATPTKGAGWTGLTPEKELSEPFK